MGKQITIKPGYSRVFLPDGKAYDAGTSLTLSDLNVSRLTSGMQRAITVGATVADPPTPGSLGSGSDVRLVSSAGSSQILSIDDVQDLTLTSPTCALSLPSTTPKQGWVITLVLRQDSSGGRAVTWPGSVSWLGDGLPPSLNTSPGGITIISLFSLTKGATWLGSGTVEQIPALHKASHAPGGIDALDYTLVNRKNTLANRPAATSANNGTYYFASDERGGTLYRSNGVKWEQQALPLGDSLRPTALAYTTFRRSGATIVQANHLVSGRRTLVAIDLPAGLLVNSITFFSGGTAAVSPTAQWFEIFDPARNRLAVTNDDSTTPWPANNGKTLVIPGGFTTTYAGLHHLGITVVATTVPTLLGVSGSAVLLNASPIIVGTSDTGLTSAATAPATAAAITAVGNQPYAGVS